MPNGFDLDPIVFIHPDGVSFQLARPAVYTGSQGDSWTIPAGFSTDFASIPAAVSWATPKLGAYTLAALVHDLLCTGLNDWHDALRKDGIVEVIHGDGGWNDVVSVTKKVRGGPDVPKPTANAVDTDAIFRKIARSYGTDPVTAALLWVGVRWGALANPARRAGWLRTAPKVLGLSLLLAPVLVPATVLALVGRGVLALARRVFR